MDRGIYTGSSAQGVRPSVGMDETGAPPVPDTTRMFILPEFDPRLDALLETLAAAFNVEFYRSLYRRHGVDQILSFPDIGQHFDKIPFLEPEDIIRRFNELRSPSAPAVRVTCSGGTLGQPKVLFRSGADWRTSVHNVAELFMTAGVLPGTSMLILQPFGMWAIGHLALEACALLKSMAIPAGNHEDFQFISYLMDHFPIEAVFVTPSLWKRFTLSLTEPPLRPIRILAAGERLVEEDRKYFSNFWRGGVYNIYGSEETDGLAAECEFHTGMHILEHSFLFEILAGEETIDWSRPGTYEGELVVTSLYHRGTPLVRYRLGDKVRIARNARPCACGNANPVLEVLGKGQEIIQFFDATRISLSQLDAAIRNALGREVYFQVILENADRRPFIETVTILIDDKLGQEDCEKVLFEVANCSRELADSVRNDQLELKVTRSDGNCAWTQKGKRRRILDHRAVRQGSLCTT